MNFDMLDVICDVKVLSTDRGLLHIGGLVNKYSKMIIEKKYHESNKFKD